MILEALGAMVLFATSTILLKKVSAIPFDRLDLFFQSPNIYYVIGMIATALIGFSLSYLAMRGGKSAVVAAIVSSAPLMVMILSVLFLGESYSLKEIAGIVIIIIGLVVLSV